MKIVGTMRRHRQLILIGMLLIGFILLLANLPGAECAGEGNFK